MHMCSAFHAGNTVQHTPTLIVQIISREVCASSIQVYWSWNILVLSCCEKYLCPASSTADKTVHQVLLFLPVPGFHDNHCSKISVHACSHWQKFVLAALITEGSTPKDWATCFHSAATSLTMNLLMSSSVGRDSMLIGVWASEEVRAEKTEGV